MRRGIAGLVLLASCAHAPASRSRTVQWAPECVPGPSGQQSYYAVEGDTLVVWLVFKAPCPVTSTQ